MKDFNQLLEEKGVFLSPLQVKQFDTYFEMLVEWNDKMNLTAITNKKAVYLKHFYDSITPSFFYDFHKTNSLCDVGAGAGFPSIPLKIIFPYLKVTIVDSLKKRIGFLSTLVDQLGIEDVSLYHDRAETFGRRVGMRESFDMVTARAVARLNILSEYCLPLIKVDGVFMAMKGAYDEEEHIEAYSAIATLGGELKKIIPFVLPEEKSKRHLLIIEKNKATPKKYPRKPGIPAKQPL